MANGREGENCIAVLTCPVLISRLDERSLRLRMRRLWRKVFAAVPVRDDPGGADLHRVPCEGSKTDRQGRRAGRPAPRHPQEAAGTHRGRGRRIGASQEVEIRPAPFLTAPGSADSKSRMLKPHDARLMRCYPVSSRVSHVGNDDVECSTPVELAPTVQSSLF
jgi:hypothetical protein